MAEQIYYTTRNLRLTFQFYIVHEGDRFQAYVVNGPALPPHLVRSDEDPPGCELKNGSYRIRWFDMARVTSLGQARTLAAFWADRTEHFMMSGKWQLPYTTNDGQDRFNFSIEKVGGSLRVYIDSKPDYRGRADDTYTVHLLNDGRYYICWEGRIANWNVAEDIATVWAERTQKYIRSGEKFS